MAAFKTLFGDNLLTQDGLKPTEDVLRGKSAVAIYFSAHWCGPCRNFTPKLAEMYTESFQAKGMEIVFASGDKDDAAFNDYFKDMPWVALPFDQRDVKNALNKKYKVKGIPSLVILNSAGEVITKDGRGAVMKDPKGEKYPWIPPSAEEKGKELLALLGEDLIAKTAGKPIGLYFSAHWCPPCKGFTPKLAEWYNNGLKEKMEIIFVSSDHNSAAFDDYFKDMPWLALPYEKRAEKETLSELLGVEGIPSFAVINPDGTVITTDGRSKVSKDPTGSSFPDEWLPQPFNDVNDDPDPLNQEQCLIALGNAEATIAAVKSVAKTYHEKAGKVVDKMPVRFFHGPDGGVTAQLRTLTKLEGNQLILLDIPDDGAFYVCDGDASSHESVQHFLDAVTAGTVSRKQLQK